MRAEALSPHLAPTTLPATSARAELYAAILHPPGGTHDTGAANRDFNDLWLRFVSAVAQLARQQTPAAFAQKAIQQFTAAAGPRLEQARTATNTWHATDRIATQELGTAQNPARFRALAEAGGAILEHLAASHAAAGALNPADFDLVNACEQWLAVNGVQDDAVEALAQPTEARARVDAWSQRLCDAVGLPHPGGGHGKTNTAGGFATPPDFTAVFAGSPGTGKTLAAQWLATRTGLDVLRVDLSQVVSRYIGETEKNLDRVFGDAQEAHAFLLFDEGDALMGKRTAVGDAHDRYANVEAGLLLERLASFDGSAVLLTHADDRGIDPRLLERADARVVRFPLPPR